MGRSKTNKRLSYPDLEKVFGIGATTIGYRIRHMGMTLGEAISTPVGYEKYEIIGNRYGRYTVESRIPNSSKYNCLCDCGNKFIAERSNIVSGRQQSCGCLNMENRHNRHGDLSGQVINGVLLKEKVESERDPAGHYHVRYLCVCPHCGNDFISRLSNIKSGNTGGCGCTRNHYRHIDLVGRDFEFCHVDERLPNQIQPSGGSRVIYKCTCCCGNTYTDWAFTILHGRSNCGCQKKVTSWGEARTRKWLDEHNINYSTQYWFDDLRGERNMPYFFDFGILDDDENLLCLIEYQGEQHYHESPNSSILNFGKKQREITDPAKKAYCKQNNIKLFEIAYFEDVDSRCEEIFNLLYHENTVPSSQETA